ncbi:Stk1 family PASTA domain-containing Ser/Thr kinase [Salinactinospora qingdaonensis]|uniref:non-specific serine/threonine protein kinase n=1 Tax=Salinactinospora qingdaonensis TaxID=702744 RepID=A0ABP7FFS1_9ACTN
MDMTTADSLVGATLDHRYYIESRVAGGGMATVYVAQDLRLDRRVALKVMHSSLAQDPSFVQRFTNEAHSVARLSHPNVVQVYDQGADNGHVFLAMEYVPGRTLRDLLNARGRLGPREALQIMVPVLAGLGAAHQAGMVHRDIKPENVLLTQEGHVKVVDFGLARVAEATQQGLTKTGTLMGTAAYLAPEQISQSFSDARTDVYAAGIVLYELLTGQQPHTGDTPLAVAYQHVNEDVPRPSRVVEGLGADIDRLVTRATEREAQYRPADAGSYLAEVFEVYRAMPETDPSTTLTAAAATSGTAGEGGDNNTLIVDVSDLDFDGGDRGGRGRRRRRNPPYPMLLIGAVTVLVVLGLGWWLLFGRYVNVPEVVGESENRATQALSSVGLQVEMGDPVYSEEVDEGDVAKVDPGEGSRGLPGDTITLHVSKGPQYVEMPDVTGKTVDEARSLLEEQGITQIEEEQSVSYDHPSGTVFATTPGSGDDADREAGVTLQVSAGFSMPSVVGLQQNQAKETLETNGLDVSITEQASEDVPAGQVIEQSPAEGEGVSKGNSVTITVSSGPDKIEIPDVKGMRLDKAKKQLKELGFSVKVRRPVGGNQVQEYNPKGEAKKGTEIELWIFGRTNGDDD